MPIDQKIQVTRRMQHGTSRYGKYVGEMDLKLIENIPGDKRLFKINQYDLISLKKDLGHDYLVSFTENSRTYITAEANLNKREISQYFMIDHPNLLSIAGYTIINEAIRLVYESTGLEPLSGFKGKLDFHKIMKEICSALFYLHSLGFVHLQLNPSNIYIDSNGSIKISSFSFNDQKYFHHSNRSDFIAPEINYGSYDFLSDVYSVGVIACFIIFSHLESEDLEEMYHHESVLFDTKLGKVNEFLSCDIQAIIRAMVADDPNQRPTFAEVILMLNSLKSQDERIELKLNHRYETGDDYLYFLNSKTNVGLFHCLMYHRLHGNKDKEIEMIRNFQLPCDDFISYYSRYLTLSDDEIRNDEELIKRYMHLDKSDYRFYLMPPPSAKYHKMNERIVDHLFDERLSPFDRYHQMIHEMNITKENRDNKLWGFNPVNCLDDIHFQFSDELYQVGQIYFRSDDMIYKYKFFSTKNDEASQKRMKVLNGREKKNELKCDILIVEDKVVEINKNAETVSIPHNMKYIGERACEKGKIVSLDLQNTKIIAISYYSFNNCRNLRFVSIPSSLEVIDDCSFENCDQLEKITIPSDSRLSKIKLRAFGYCEKLEGFYFPHTLKFIGGEAFEYCESIKVFDLRVTRVTQIERDAFKSNSIKVIMLPATVSTTSIINCCDNQLIVDKDHRYVKSDDKGNIYLQQTLIQWNKKSKHALIRRGIERISARCFFRSNIVSLTLPASVVQISESAFERCYKLKWIHFPKNSRLIEIQSFAFSGCNLLNNIKFPKLLQKIGCSAFNHCTSLDNIYFPPDSQLEAFDDLFFFTKIKHLSIPPSVRRLGNICNGMHKLKTFSLCNDLFESNQEGTAILSKDGSELICVISTVRKYNIPESVRIIKKGAFNSSNIKGCLFIPSSVEIIEDKAFEYCYGLKSLEFGTESRLKYFGKNGKLNSTKHFIISRK